MNGKKIIQQKTRRKKHLLESDGNENDVRSGCWIYVSK